YQDDWTLNITSQHNALLQPRTSVIIPRNTLIKFNTSIFFILIKKVATSSHVRMDSYGPSILAATILFLVLGVVFVSLRYYTRVVIRKTIGHDDFLILFALGLYIIMASLLFVGVQRGIGQHKKGMDMEDIVQSSKVTILHLKSYNKLTDIQYVWFTVLVYISVVTAVKASYATCLLRLTEASPCAYALWAGLAVNIILCFIASLYLIFNCQPISYAWRQADPAVDGYCNYDSADVLGYAWAGLSIALYLLFTLIPAVLVWDMQMHIKTKAFVVTVLGLGLLAGVACAVRIGVFAVDLDYTDPLYTISSMLIWSVVEAGLGIVASCIATLRPLLRHYNVQGLDETEPDGEAAGHEHGSHRAYKMSTVSQILNKFTGHGAHTVTVIHQGSRATIPVNGQIKERKTFVISTLQRSSADMRHEREMQGVAGKVPEPDDVNTGGW
ncbi:hypothetical protein DSL72_006906, partial [Monilinia vaccinii-corymbosi]